MSRYLSFRTTGILTTCRPLTLLLLFGGFATVGPGSSSASAQGFYFESWSGGYGSRLGGVNIGIGVHPSSPIPYGVRPSQIFPPLGYPGFYTPLGPAIPFTLRDHPADVHARIYQQYRQQLEGPYPYGRVDPRQQSDIRNYLRGLMLPPLSGVPPVVAIEPLADPGPGGESGHGGQPDQFPPEQLAGLLRDAATRLTAALSRRGEEGEVWLDYLAPDLIVEAIDEGLDPRELGELLLNYEGVLAGAELRWVWRLDGFAETRQWLRQYIAAAAPGDRAGQEGDRGQALPAEQTNPPQPGAGQPPAPPSPADELPQPGAAAPRATSGGVSL